MRPPLNPASVAIDDMALRLLAKRTTPNTADLPIAIGQEEAPRGFVDID